jgi:UDP-GlcNAc:undecaprenyl-phosphate GlcNAc-1-phosphate transferase
MMVEFLTTLIISLILVKLVITYSHKLNLYDIPNERSHHCNITPSGAGLGFVSAFFISFFLFYPSLIVEYWHIFLSIALVFATGIYDDKHEVSAKFKFVSIFIAVFVLWLGGLSIDSLGVWYGYDLALPSLIALFFSMFALSGFTNALNLIDGIDGLSSSVSLVILAFFMALGVEYHSNIIELLSLFAIASILGFLFFNWYPAKIFMGDSGSLTIGFIIAILAVLSLEYVHPIAVIYLAALPVLDTLVVMTRRIRRGKSPFSPDKTHIHHIMVKFFDNNVPRTVLFLSLLQLVFSSIGYMILDNINKTTGHNNIPLFSLIGFMVMFVLFYMIFTGIKKRQNLLEL